MAQQTLHHTAILLFSRTPEGEAGVKTFARHLGNVANRSIARLLINQTINTARKSGLPLITHDSRVQANAVFGVRLADAIESVFHKGYDRVIVFGNDSPELTTGHLDKARKSLLFNDIVLGPATDGGVYLIGLSRAGYQRNSFLALPWETDALCAAWSAYESEQNTEIEWLSPLSDIDQAEDLARLIGRLPSLSLTRRALLQIFDLGASFGALVDIPRPYIVQRTGIVLRGPP